MSSYRDFYIGPYLIVKNKYITTTESRKVCVNDKCKKFDATTKTKFCGECGQTVEDKKFEVQDILSVNHLLNEGDLVDKMYVIHNNGVEIYKDREIVLPNNSDGRSDKYNIDYSFCGELEISEDDKTMDTAWFIIKYGKIIDLLVSKFGEENVEFKWGLVIYYS